LFDDDDDADESGSDEADESGSDDDDGAYEAVMKLPVEKQVEVTKFLAYAKPKMAKQQVAELAQDITAYTVICHYTKLILAHVEAGNMHKVTKSSINTHMRYPLDTGEFEVRQSSIAGAGLGLHTRENHKGYNVGDVIGHYSEFLVPGLDCDCGDDKRPKGHAPGYPNKPWMCKKHANLMILTQYGKALRYTLDGNNDSTKINHQHYSEMSTNVMRVIAWDGPQCSIPIVLLVISRYIPPGKVVELFYDYHRGHTLESR
jgi:hypothetical protein